MGLKNCEDCGQIYSTKADKCIHCGSPNQNDEDAWSELIVSFIVIGLVVWFLYANGAVIGGFFNQLLNSFNIGIVSEQNLKDCSNERIKTTMKQTFNESPYAQTLHLNAVMIDAQEQQPKSGYILSCNANITLNNNEKLKYTFNFSEQNGQYLIEGVPRNVF